MPSSVPYILARTLREAHDFAKSEGFERGRYRVVNSPGTIKSVRNAELYLVPGWDKRHDRFAMRSAIKWTKMNVMICPPPPVVNVIAVPDETPVPKHHSDLVKRVNSKASMESGVRSAEEASGPGTEDGIPVGGAGRRRRRCKECDQLHYKEDSCQISEDV